jgi:hypothetical protein
MPADLRKIKQKDDHRVDGNHPKNVFLGQKKLLEFVHMVILAISYNVQASFSNSLGKLQSNFLKPVRFRL